MLLYVLIYKIRQINSTYVNHKCASLWFAKKKLVPGVVIGKPFGKKGELTVL